jgi:hypothetical protein
VGITYINKVLSAPVACERTISLNLCNDVGIAGLSYSFVNWSRVKKYYSQWFNSQANFELGAIQLISIERNVYVCNLIAQHDIRVLDGFAPIRYEAIDIGFDRLSVEANKLKASVHLSKSEVLHAGGKWENVATIISETLLRARVPTYVYY